MEKKAIFCVVFMLITLAFPSAALAAAPGDIISEAALVMDAETGQVLYDKSGDRIMYPASTTKIMTALLASERATMDETATVTASAVDIDEWDSANIALSPGEILPMDSLMYGLMLPSANDAANVIAEHIAGNQRDFAQFMTERAHMLGAVNTHFANAHGLHDPNHYTTALDLALITREAIKNPVFMKYFGTDTHTIPPTNLQPSERPFTNYQYMLVSTSQYYDARVIGGKVGFTNEAMHTMSTVAKQNGRTLICVVMYSQNRGEKFSDTAKLLDFGFDEFTTITVPQSEFPGFSTRVLNGEVETGTVTFRGNRDFTALLHDSMDLSALSVSYSHNYPFEMPELVAAYAEFEIPSNDPLIPSSLGRIKLDADISLYDEAGLAGSPEKFELLNTPWSIPIVAATTMAILTCGLFISRRIRLQRRRRRRRERLERLRREQHTPYHGPVPQVSRKNIYY